MAPTVETTSGTVQGSQGPGYQSFLGIPFAAPSTGERRFRPPAPVTPRPGIRDATHTGPWAPQNPTARAARIGGEDDPQDEDCLSLNVWTPAADQARRPVMVWIHGGGFATGSGAGKLYQGDRLARRGDVVVVTINYRLGILGFAASEALRDPETGAAGNWGLLDQVAALEWVRDNIAGFGGAPDNVTIFGESAGSMSVTTLLATPAAAGLFRRAIAESGPPAVAPAVHGERTFDEILSELGMKRGPAVAAELRTVPVDRLLSAQAAITARLRFGEGVLPWVPVVDGASLPELPISVAGRGGSAGVELIIGTNRDETTLFSVGDRNAFLLDDERLRRRLSRVFARRGGSAGVDERVQQVIDLYAKTRSDRGEVATPFSLWTAILTDLIFRVPSMQFAEAQARHQANTFAYLFTWPSPVLGGILGAPHALELPFVFGTLDLPGFATFTGADKDPDALVLAGQVMESWTTFARTGRPDGDGGWPRYTADTDRKTMVLDRSSRVEAAPMEPERRLIAEFLTDESRPA